MAGEAVRLHEAGHQVVAVALGHRAGGVTVDGGQTLGGCSLRHRPAAVYEGRPFIAWPAVMRGTLEADVVIWMAGQVSELLLAAPAPGALRLPAPMADQAEDVAERLPVGSPPELVGQLPGPSPELLARFARIVDDPEAVSDAEAIARSARIAHGDDLPSLAEVPGGRDEDASRCRGRAHQAPRRRSGASAHAVG